MTREQIILLQQTVLAAEVLSAAMVESEAHGADYEHVESPWAMLTEAIQNCYKTGAMKISELLP